MRSFSRTRTAHRCRLSHDGAHAGVSGAEYAALRAAALGAAPAVAAAIDAQLLADEDNMDVV